MSYNDPLVEEGAISGMQIQSWRRINWRSLSVQLIFSFVAVSIIAALVVGLPAIWLIRSQSENQAWSQVEQGSRATQALLAARQKEVNGLALLTAERPVLPELLAADKTAELQDFLNTLREGPELDFLLVCDNLQRPVAHVGGLAVADLCRKTNVSGYYLAPDDADRHLWLLAIETIEGSGDSPGFVIAGMVLDNFFAAELRGQTGLEHILLVEDEIMASSLPIEAARTASELLSGGNEDAIDSHRLNS